MAHLRRHSSFDPTLSRGVIAIILVITGSIVILSFFHKAGPLGVVLDEWLLSFLFGRLRYALPAILLILSWFLLRPIDYQYRSTHIIGAGLFFLSVASLIHLRLPAASMWGEAIQGHGGGVFGMLAWPLKTYLGLIASYIVLVGLIMMSVILIFHTYIALILKLFKSITEGFKRFGKNLNLVKENILSTVHEEQRLPESWTNNEEDEEEEPFPQSRKFFAKHIDSEEIKDNETDEEKTTQENTANEVNISRSETDTVTTWSKPVIIRALPPLSLLSDKRGKPTSGDIEVNAEIIANTLREFGIDVTMGEVRVGPTVTQYALKPSKGVKLSRITSLANDLSLALAAHPIRIEAPIPGQSLVGIEVPNQKAAMVTFKELLESEVFNKRSHNLMIALGKDVAGKVWFGDLSKMPHLLIAGATGSGKTVCINTIIMSLLYQNTAETLRFIMVDPKRVELPLYNGIPHLLTPVITNTHKTINALRWTISEMDRRFDVLSRTGSRDIASYNRKYPNQKLPQIIFVIDELADLMATAANDVEAGIIRLAQMARAVGIYLILATQRPSVDVITGLMKANIPARIAFSVASLIDSRTILDMPGAEKLLGRGDMLFATAELGKPIRIQGAFISEEEANQVVAYLQGGEEPVYDDTITAKPGGNNGTLNMFGGPSDNLDPLFADAKQTIIEAGKASASLLQRRLKIGYARAARILDELEAAGIIGPADGAKPRDILLTTQETDDEGSGAMNVFRNEGNEEDEMDKIDTLEKEQK